MRVIRAISSDFRVIRVIKVIREIRVINDHESERHVRKATHRLYGLFRLLG
jgi:hypothetical protein